MVVLEASVQITMRRQRKLPSNISSPCTWTTPGLHGVRSSARAAAQALKSMEASYVEERRSEVHKRFAVSLLHGCLFLVEVLSLIHI